AFEIVNGAGRNPDRQRRARGDAGALALLQGDLLSRDVQGHAGEIAEIDDLVDLPGEDVVAGRHPIRDLDILGTNADGSRAPAPFTVNGHPGEPRRAADVAV